MQDDQKVTIHGYCLNGMDCNLINVLVANNQECKQDLPQVIVVMDVSSSMGHLASVALNGAIPRLMLEAGYASNAKIHVITFGSNTNVFLINGEIPTVRSLQNYYIEASGATYMHGVFAILSTCLAQYTRQRVVVIAISDGEVADMQDIIKACDQYTATPSIAYVDVVMIRLKTSRNGEPDTRSLACLSKFSTVAKNCIHDVEFGLTNDEVESKLIAVCFPHLIHNKATVLLQADGIKRLPIDIDISKISINSGENICFLLPKSRSHILVDDVVTPIQMCEKMSASVLTTFCDHAQQRIKLEQVIGNEVRVMQMWFKKFDSHVSNIGSNDAAIPNIQSRIRQFTRQCNKLVKSQLQAVLETTNIQKLRDLNLQQRADYLRESTSTSLAKRAAKTKQQHEDQGETNTLQQQVARVLQVQFVCQDNDPNIVSFYSVSNNADLFETLLHENVQVENMDDLDVIRIFGLLGICYEAPIRDWIDPYTFRVTNVFDGSFYLSVNDLRDANCTKTSDGKYAELKAPGTNCVITGVLPLRKLNPQLFDCIFHLAPKLFEAHTSINMRRMLAPVRSDLLGERIGLLMYFMRQGITYQWQRDVFEDVLTQLKMLMELPMNKQEFAFLNQLLTTNTSLRKHLTGANAISCIEKVMIALLTHTTSLDASYLQSVMQDLFEFDAYHVARHIFADRVARDSILQEMFLIDVKDCLNWLPLKNLEYITDDAKRVVVLRELSSQLACEHVVLNYVHAIHFMQTSDKMKWLPKQQHFANYYKQIMMSDDESKEMFHIDNMTQLLLVVAAINSPSEQDRMLDIDLCQQQTIIKIMQEYYADFYQKQANLEMQRRDDQKLTTVVYLLAKTNDFEKFLFELKENIPNQQHRGCALLLNELKMNCKICPLFCEKLKLLLTGRSVGGDIMWGGGNFHNDFWQYETFFDFYVWQTLVNMRQDLGVWQYRSSNESNRHGHCNSNPSNWALNVYGKSKGKYQ